MTAPPAAEPTARDPGQHHRHRGGRAPRNCR